MRLDRSKANEKKNVRFERALSIVCTMIVAGCGGDEQDGASGAAAGSAGADMGGVTDTMALSVASDCTTEDGGTAVSGLCADATLNTLTRAEATTLCSDTGAYIEGAVDRAVGCKYVAIVAAASTSAPTDEQMQAACQASEDSCNADDTIAGPGRQTQCSEIPDDCTATLAQYATCVMDEAALFQQEADALVSCSELTFGNLSSVYDVPPAATMAESCLALTQTCSRLRIPYIN